MEKVTKEQARNGLLFYVSLLEHRKTIARDVGKSMRRMIDVLYETEEGTDGREEAVQDR